MIDTNRKYGSLIYSEKYWVPWWWYLAVLITMYPIYFTIDLKIKSNNTSLIICLITTLLSYLWFFSLSQDQIKLYSKGVLETKNAAIETKYFSKLFPVTADLKYQAMGPQLNPTAYVYHHFWIKQMVLCTLNDPQDPTPYWLISTKKPELIISKITEINSGS